ncbi:GNAT family N-acetyltransferase [Comamonas sp. BIGb0124]|uniref:GNAT family N-acetyltransferase n=1 Tax=Comamonas sp. BIGb0124 TaxID=2485130 RepID=UPI0013154483|nr:GNAT family N-acetyltransferase [Comamonas sp. BIGb0124]
MAEADLGEVSRIQALAYGADFLEADAVIRQRWQVSPHTAWVACTEGRAEGYLVAYRSAWGCITSLHGAFEPEPAGDCLYVHDLALAPALAGHGVGRRLVARAWQAGVEAGCRLTALVCVQQAGAFWRRLGYETAVPADGAMQRLLQGYGDGACYMHRRLPQEHAGSPGVAGNGAPVQPVGDR